MLALPNELFNVFPILFHVKMCVGAMLSFQKRKRVTVYQTEIEGNWVWY